MAELARLGKDPMKTTSEAATGDANRVFDLDLERFASLPIRFESHCFGCTAGAGSSCGGATAS